MFDRTDVLWREEPTPAPADKTARGNDQARQVNDQPDAPGQRPTDAADRRTDGPPPEPEDQRPARQHRDDAPRAQLATERHARELAYTERRVHEAGDKQTAIAAPPHDPRTPLVDWRLRQMERQDARHPIREDHPEEWTEGLDRPLGKDGQAAFERAQERASAAAQERGPDPPPAEVKAVHMQHARDDQAAWEARRAELTADRDPPGPLAPRTTARTDRRARTAAHGPKDKHGPTRTGPASNGLRRTRPRPGRRTSSARRSPVPTATAASTTPARRSPAPDAPAPPATAMQSPT